MSSKDSVVDPALLVHLNKQGLVRYKISTDMAKFNARRPGNDYAPTTNNEADERKNAMIVRNSIENAKKNVNTSLSKEMIITSDGNKQPLLPPSFIDARFYTDAEFLKLGNQLKNNKLDVKRVDRTESQSEPVTSEKNDYEVRIEYLEDQMRGIYEQLQIQTQVNVELKKMLVASVSGDENVHYKLERLIRDKQVYEYEIDKNKKDIQRLNEEIEQLGIQCDMWRSKFLASRLLADEHSAWRSFLFMLDTHNEKIVKNLIGDSELLNFKLNQAVQLVDEIKKNEQPHRKTLNNLQAANILLSSLASMATPSDPSKHLTELTARAMSTLNLANRKSKTLNELVALEWLEQFDWVKSSFYKCCNHQAQRVEEPSHIGYYVNPSDSLDQLEQLVNKIKAYKSSKFARLYQPAGINSDPNLLLNVCIKCKGQLKVV